MVLAILHAAAVCSTMDTQAERRNEVIGVAKDFLGAKTAGEFAGAVADKMAEGGQKMFMQGIKRIINSKGIVYEYIQPAISLFLTVHDMNLRH